MTYIVYLGLWCIAMTALISYKVYKVIIDRVKAELSQSEYKLNLARKQRDYYHDLYRKRLDLERQGYSSIYD